MSDSVVKTAMGILTAAGLTRVAAAGIVGNAKQESGWNPASVGSGGGGLWGFTAGAISLASLQAYARQQKQRWDSVVTQTNFLLAHLPSSVKAHLNAARTPAEAAAIFMNEWERPAAATANLANRQAGAEEAFRIGGGKGFAGLVGTTGTVSDGGGLVSSGQRSGLLKGLIWVLLVLGGAALAGVGVTRAMGAGGG